MNGDEFRVERWRIVEPATVEFDFACPRFGAFRERVTFPHAGETSWTWLADGMPELLTLLHAALGTSYYKLSAAPRVSVRSGPVGADGADAVQRLYAEGMAEFRFRMGLLGRTVQTSIATAPGIGGDALPLPGTAPRSDAPALVAFGGGKDSFVADDLVRRAGLARRRVSVALSDSVASTLRAISADEDLTIIQRTLDANLPAATARSGWTGHVPVTAINSLCLAVQGLATGGRMVVFANERSADEPTVLYSDPPINHQYSKSYAFERPLHDAIVAATGGRLFYFSVLRAVSELWIARYLTRLPDAMQRFTSCNRNFAIAATTPRKWCGECAKCAFTFLILAPFVARDRLVGIFAANPLARAEHLPLYAQILGLTDLKPWDCVGSVEEARAALWAIHAQAEWQELPVVANLRAAHDVAEWGTHWPAQFVPQNLDNTPDLFHGLLHAG